VDQRRISSAPWKLAGAGVVIGGIAAWLVSKGNPGNMGVCIACFMRDIAGTFGGAAVNMGGVAYLRPELPGLLLGAFATALVAGEFRPRGSSAWPLRFAMGFIFMVAALVFLGCTVRAWLRVGGGDLNAVVGVMGLTVGIGVGSAFLRSGYRLGRARDLPMAAGFVAPIVALMVVALASATALGAKPPFLTITPANAKATPQGAVVVGQKVLKPAGARLLDGAVVTADGKTLSTAQAVGKSKPMPGGKRAPLIVSLIAGAFIGIVAQRSRLCTTGGIRDVILWRSYDKLIGIVALVFGALVINVALGQFRLGFADQPVAHSDSFGNFAAMAVSGLAAVLMGGCPLRQVVMAGEGDGDAGAALLGMLVGALFAHGTNLASSPRSIAPGALVALALMSIVLLGVGFWRRTSDINNHG
jgi:uncharacterized protein